MSVEDRRFTCTVGKKQIADSLVNCVNDNEYTPDEVVDITKKLILYLHRNHNYKLFDIWNYLKPKFEHYLNVEQFKKFSSRNGR